MSISVNEYFKGKVKSLGFVSDGRDFTAGVIQPGEYEFSTSKQELMTITLGSLEFFLPNAAPQTLAQGQTITIPANIDFQVKAKAGASYICEYV